MASALQYLLRSICPACLLGSQAHCVSVVEVQQMTNNMDRYSSKCKSQSLIIQISLQISWDCSWYFMTKCLRAYRCRCLLRACRGSDAIALPGSISDFVQTLGNPLAVSWASAGSCKLWQYLGNMCLLSVLRLCCKMCAFILHIFVHICIFAYTLDTTRLRYHRVLQQGQHWWMFFRATSRGCNS